MPFVHVTDVERSVAFYRHLGFVAHSEHRPTGRLDWAALESDGAEVMFALASEPFACEDQAVLFYLYSPDLATLRARLLAAGIDAGPIEDGTPGPSHEMRVADPEGFVLMVAQTEQG